MFIFSNGYSDSITLVEQDDGLYRGGARYGALSSGSDEGTVFINTSLKSSVVKNVGSGVLFNIDKKHFDLSFAKFDGEVLTSINDGAGGFYVGGMFTTVNGLVRPYLAHIDPNGGLDKTFNVDLKSPPKGLYLYNDQLYYYTKNSIGKIDLVKKTADQLFHAVVDDGVEKIVVSKYGVYVSGVYMHVNGKLISGLARLNVSTGESLPCFSPRHDYVTKVDVYNGIIYMASTDFIYEIDENNGQLIKKMNWFDLGNTNSWECDPYSKHSIFVSAGWLYRFDQGGDENEYISRCVSRYRLPSVTLDQNFSVNQMIYFNNYDKPMVASDGNYMYFYGMPYLEDESNFIYPALVRVNKDSFKNDNDFIKSMYKLYLSPFINTISIYKNDIFIGGASLGVLDGKENIENATLLKYNIKKGAFDKNYVVHGAGRYDLMAEKNGLIYSTTYISPGHYDIVKRSFNDDKPLNFSLEKQFKRPLSDMLVQGKYIYTIGLIDDPIANSPYRNQLLRFDAISGRLDRTFIPALDSVPLDMVVSGNALFVTESKGRRLVKINIDTGKVDEIFNPILQDSEKIIGNITVYNDVVYYSFSGSNKVYAVDAKTGQSRLGNTALLMPNEVTSITPEGKYIYIGLANGVQRIRSADHKLDDTFSIHTDGAVYHTAQAGMNLVLYGDFTTCNGQVRNGLAILQGI